MDRAALCGTRRNPPGRLAQVDCVLLAGHPGPCSGPAVGCWCEDLDPSAQPCSRCERLREEVRAERQERARLRALEGWDDDPAEGGEEREAAALDASCEVPYD